MDDDIRDQPSAASRFGSWLAIKYQHYLDRLTPYTGVRWGIAIFTILLFCWRIFAVQGFYIVTYALFIYYLNMFLAFLTPRIDPAFEADSEGKLVSILCSELLQMKKVPLCRAATTKNSDRSCAVCRSSNFGSFVCCSQTTLFRLKTMKSTLIAFFMTFFELFDIPVFWPILVMYFFVLTFLTMKRQIMHMIRYRYIPFTFGKPRPHGKEDSGKLVASDSTAHNSPLLIPASPSA
ncbi:Protein RER1 [Aphelenchoides besseyi]|nr:Protein RER1 [Aphelenchoides besseyi]KAI6211410.1 Protein RER1 [Aphelenchoides besseyi]